MVFEIVYFIQALQLFQRVERTRPASEGQRYESSKRKIRSTENIKDMQFSNNFKTSLFAILKVLKILAICILGPIILLLIIALFNKIGIIDYAFAVPLFILFFVGLVASADPTNLVFRGKTHFIILGISALSIGLIAGKLLGTQWGVLFSGSFLYIYYVYKTLKKN